MLAVVVLSWVVASQAEDEPGRNFSTDSTDTAAIESVSTIELVTADRPTVFPTAKRGEGLRPMPGTPPAGPALDAASSFAWLAWRSGSIGWSPPITLHLAGRAPPRIAGD